uniref:F-box protein At5g07610-like n=1 Tax=Erigeron canadensis TaxID=72917 RepID=UPI001CB9C8E7|nr:F-box protein At5g07610-like [Erigeron canadensis]XP_043625176.1 F-box protein At5g07610-like [Erigeron canadensis]
MGRGIASKKQKKLIVDDDEFPSSVYAVISNDDLLIDILLRLPASSIVGLRSVSKRWLSLIAGPVFTLWWSQKRNVNRSPFGFFLQRYITCENYAYVPRDIRFAVNRSPPLNTTTNFGFDFPDEGNVEILQSCNGLLLCRYSIKTDEHHGYDPSDTHYVYNPSINQFMKLPSPCNLIGVDSYSIGGMRLTFDPIESLYYKLVFATTKHDGHHFYVEIYTYSSETGTWSVCPDRFPKSDDFFNFRCAKYWNNSLHWINKRTKHVKLDLEHLVLTTTPLPQKYSNTLFESCGCLLCVCKCTSDETLAEQIAIYEMRKGYSEWSMRYLVNLDDIWKLFPRVEGLEHAVMFGSYHVLCIVLGEEEDPFLVLEMCGKVVQYNIVLETIRELYDYRPLNFESTELYRGCYPLYASFASV